MITNCPALRKKFVYQVALHLIRSDRKLVIHYIIYDYANNCTNLTTKHICKTT